MEKRSPQHRLSVLKTLIEAGKVRMTASAVTGAEVLGFDRTGVMGIVLALTPADFFKSMTTYADHTIWQDVYHPKTSAGDVYLKLTVIDDVVIVSFKEL
jgi:motility quorum-sensing regulator / GCU-specific mRNA interferase toxin